MARTATVEKPETPDWFQLLADAIHEPGRLAEAHKFFHNYSLANRWLASTQLYALGLPLTPINTFKGWLNAKRPVMKGQKSAIALIMPVPVKGLKKDEETGESKRETIFNRFMLKSHWFHMGQTDGEEFSVEEVSKDWKIEQALQEFKVVEAEFSFASVSDLRKGYAQEGLISVSPMEEHPTYGKIRQLARIVLGHVAAVPGKSVPTDELVRTIEAETVAYLVAATLGLTGLEESRAVLQDAIASEGRLRIPEKSANRAFSAADKILNAGIC